MRPSGNSKADFRARLSQVAVGWATEDLLRHAGEPESRAKGSWHYSWQEGGLGCVQYAYFSFRIENGRVAEILSGGGNKIIE